MRSGRFKPHEFRHPFPHLGEFPYPFRTQYPSGVPRGCVRVTVRTLNVILRKQSAVIAAALISGTVWMASPAQAVAPFPSSEGTVLSTISPATNGCPDLNRTVEVAPDSTLNGTVAQVGMRDIWRVTGVFKADRTFHLDGQELGGARRTGTVDGYVRGSDGSLILTIGKISGSSTCDNRSVWVRWFRNGNGYSPYTCSDGGSGG